MESKKYRQVVAIILVIAAAWLFSCYLYQLMLIQGESMYPTYEPNQIVLLQRNGNHYAFGDVVAFANDRGMTLVKRIVACPGDHFQISEGNMYVNNKPILFTKAIEYSGIASEPILLGSNEYFVIGDNVDVSIDSRYDEVGIIRESQLIGKVIPCREWSVKMEDE